VTIDRFHALRLTPLAVLLVVVAIPAVDALVRALGRSRGARLAAAALVLAGAVQFGVFVHEFRTEGPLRTGRFEAGVPGLLAVAWTHDGVAYVDYDDLEPLAVARWYALAQGLDQSRVARLPDGGVPPTGAIAFGQLQECDYVCERIAESSNYWIARVIGPR
jgi:hypothetical protein